MTLGTFSVSSGARRRRSPPPAERGVELDGACGREKEARKEAGEVLRINPKFSVES